MLIYGSGGHAKVIIDCLQAQKIHVSGIFDDFSKEEKLLQQDIIGPYDAKYQGDEALVIAIGDNRIRQEVTQIIHHPFGQAIHPSTLLSPTVQVGEGTVIFHQAVVQNSTVVGKHVIINTSASVDHDCEIGDFAHVSPQSTLCGGVKIGEGTHIGAGATVIPNITIGKWVTVGAGTVVIEDIPDKAVVVGNPGKIIKFKV